MTIWVTMPSTIALDTFQRSVKQDILRAKPKHKTHNNLTKEERLRLNKLRDNPHIVIKKADKGSAVVVMNTTDYLREGYRQLHDDRFYQKIDNDITSNTSDKITEQLLKMRSLDFISQKNFEYLNVKNSRGKILSTKKIYLGDPYAVQ